MLINEKNLYKFFYCFIIFHIFVWTLIPTISNNNLPLDTIEHLAWGSNLDWGFNKHPPVVALTSEIFYQIFGSQDWAYYFMSQMFVVFSFYYVFLLSRKIFENKLLVLYSVLILESIYFYNFTSPEFNVNVCQLPFWAATVFYTYNIYTDKKIKFQDCVLLGLFAALGFLSKYLFLYLLISISLLFFFSIFIKRKIKFDFKYIISFEIFIIILIPHLIWLGNNDFVTIKYGIDRTGIDQKEFINHFKYPLIFFLKQLGILIPFFFLIRLIIKKIKIKINPKDKNLIFLTFINFLPIILIFFTSLILGSKIRTMWMTPFYLYFGIFFIYLLKSEIKKQHFNRFLVGFVFVFFLSPSLYSYVSISKDDKRTDYPGKEIADLVEKKWDKSFNNKIMYVVGDEWFAGNLSYHLKSRPLWFENLKDESKNIDPNGGIIYTGNIKFLENTCSGEFVKIENQNFCMIGAKIN